MSKKLFIMKISNAVICIFLFVLSFYFNNIFSSLNRNIDEIKLEMEKNWRYETQGFLKNIQLDITLDTDNKKINIFNDSDLEKWSSENITLFKSNHNFKNTCIINLGYSHADELKYDDVIKIVKKVLGDTYKVKNCDQISNTITKMYNSEFYVDDNSAIKKLDEIRTIVLTDYKLSKYEVDSILDEAIFKKDKLILCQGELDSKEKENALLSYVSNNDYNISYIDKDGHKVLGEYVLIPQGKLGFGNQLNTKEGRININYRKLMVYTTVYADDIYKPYEKYFNNIHELELCLELLISAMLILTIIINTLRFINLIKHKKGGEKNEFASFNTDTNGIHSSIFNSIKCLWKRLRRKQS